MPDADSLAVQQSIWNAKIPVCFQLAADELAKPDHEPTPVYMMIPRLSYFPLVMEGVLSHFIPFIKLQTTPSTGGARDDSKPADPVNKACSTAWLDCSNQPLKWHYPVGLLFDLHSNAAELPWCVTLHFQDYPKGVLLDYPADTKALEVHFVSMLKEADALKHRKRMMSQMQAHDQRQLWTGLINHQFDQFWSINQRLMKPNESLPLASGDTSAPTTQSNDQEHPPTGDPDTQNIANLTSELKCFKSLPCRLYRRGYQGFLQKRLQPYSEDGKLLTLLDAMRRLFEHDSDTSQSTLDQVKSHQFIIHGIRLPEDTVMQWLCENMTFVDNFVHIVALPRDLSNYYSSSTS